MRILVGNNGLSHPGGSETYAYALISELVRRGYHVDAIGRVGPGTVSEKLAQIGVESFFKPITGRYDALFLSHASSIAMVGNVAGFKVQTCHGTHLALEQPVAGMNAYVSVSEEVHNHLRSKGITSTIIHNGVDCEKFKPLGLANSEARTILSLAHSDSANAIARAACRQIGCNLLENNKFKKWRWDMENVIQASDLVIALGRGAYEAMASGKNVVIFDKRDYMKTGAIGDGIVTKDNIELFIKNNCSGRYSSRPFDANGLAAEILKYDPRHGIDLREYALHKLNIVEQAQKYIDLVP